jgi:phospholipase C
MNHKSLRSVHFGTMLLALLGLCACGGASGKISGTPSLVFSANPTTITAGQSVTLNWQSTNATSVTITASTGSGSRTITTGSQMSGSVTDSPTQTTTYTAVATGAGGSTQPQTASVQVSQALSLVFSTNTNTITAGQSVTLTWKATSSATSVTITATSGSSSRTIPTGSQLSGSVTDSPTQTTTYTAVASGAGGSTKPQTATVQVVQPVPPQIITFTATPAELNAGQTTTITWATTNATSVTITPSLLQEGSGLLPTSGSSITPVTSTTTFSILATGPGGSATQSLSVTVPFALTLTASPSTIKPGDHATLSWQVSNGTATSLSIDNGVCASCTLPTGTATVAPTTTTTYTASAKAADGTLITQTAAVTVGFAGTGVIKHIFYMLQENRSFDMYLGELGNYQPNRLKQFGILNPPTVNGFDPNVMLTNAHTGKKVKPFHEATVCTENLSPAWDESHHDASLIGGDPAWPVWPATRTYADSDFLMQSFLDTTNDVPQQHDPDGTRAMGYYDQTDLPYYYDLATFFATSDSWHSPILANTVPNRMYLMAGTSFGHEYPDFDANHPLYKAKTIFHAMNDANVSWQYFYKDGIFLANFADFGDPKIGNKTIPVDTLISTLQGTCSGGPCDPDTTLPEVIFIESASGGSGLDEHPDNNIQSGAAYVQSIISALQNSDAWHDSIFILGYDEGGGLYDHVPPFSVPLPDQYGPGQCPDPNNGSFGYCTTGNLGGAFDLTGFRVPVIVISPYAKPHFVSHTRRDYTAILALIEETYNVPSLTARDAYWRDPSRDMSEFFDFTTPALLNPPTAGQKWPQFLNPQTTLGLCDQTKETGPTF